jgi:adenylate kinase family enzyme
MDGNYGGTMDLRLTASDTVIFLDLPTRVCLWSAIQRFRRFRGRSRPDMSDGCPEHFTFEFLWWIATYRTTRRPRILHKLETISGQKHVVILKSRKAAEDFLSSLTLQKGVR